MEDGDRLEVVDWRHLGRAPGASAASVGSLVPALVFSGFVGGIADGPEWLGVLRTLSVPLASDQWLSSLWWWGFYPGRVGPSGWVPSFSRLRASLTGDR